MESLIENGNAKRHVVVFSQDVIPNTVFYDKSDALIREYLNKGGRAVWIGDIPFYIYGKKKTTNDIVVHEIINNQIAHRVIQKPRLEGGRTNDTYTMLGSFPSFAFSEKKVQITKEGQRRGLTHQWYSMRPVHPRYIPTSLPFGKKHILAKSILTHHPIREQDIFPQRVKGEKADSFSFIKGATEFLSTYVNLAIALFGLTAIMGSIALSINLLSIQQIVVLTIIIPIIGMVIRGIYNKFRKKRFASAWIKYFEQEGEFIRVWDYNPERIINQMLKDLYKLATAGI